MTFVSQGVSVCHRAGNSEATGSWLGTKNPRWVRTSSHRGAAICITASTSVLARSFTTRGSRTSVRRTGGRSSFRSFRVRTARLGEIGRAIRFRRSRGHLPSTIPCGGRPLSAVDQ